MHSMHEAKQSRVKVDAENKRTGDSNFRAAISSARNERTSRLWAGATLLKHCAIPGQTQTAIEHSPGDTSSALFEYSAVLGRGGLERPFRASCGSGPGSNGNFEPWLWATPGRQNAATSGARTLRAPKETSMILLLPELRMGST